MKIGTREFVIPKKGLKVVDPIGRAPLPVKGKEVVWSTYWSKRYLDGAITIKGESKPTESKPSEKNK